MDLTVRDEIEQYLDENYAKELADELRASLMVFDAFDFGKPYEVLPDTLYGPTSEDSDVTRMKVVGVFNQMLDEVFQAHQIKLVDEAELPLKNQILGVLYRLQGLEDPTPTLRILETFLSDEEKFAKIIDQFSMVSETEVLMVLETIEASTLKVLQEYLYAKEQALDDLDESNKQPFQSSLLHENLKDFFHTCGTDNLGHEMMENGIMPGQPSRLYFPYVKTLFVSEEDLQTAKNILSFLFIASDTFNDPLQTYRRVSDQLIHSADRIIKVEAKISELLNQLRSYQKAKNDAKSVSVVQHPA